MNRAIEVLSERQPVSYPGALYIKHLLDSGESFVSAGINDYGNIMIKYIYYVDDGILYVAKLSDSTADEVVVTPERATLYTDEALLILLHYVLKEPAFFLDTNILLKEARYRWIGYTEEEIKALASQPKSTVYINDPFSPIEDLATHIYIIDDSGESIGRDLLEQVIDEMPTVITVDLIDDADLAIMVMSNVTVAPHKKFFEWLDENTSAVPEVAEMMRRVDGELFIGVPTLLFWQSNAIVASAFRPKESMNKAIREIERAISIIKKDA